MRKARKPDLRLRLSPQILSAMRALADARGIKLHELVKAVTIPEWLQKEGLIE